MFCFYCLLRVTNICRFINFWSFQHTMRLDIILENEDPALNSAREAVEAANLDVLAPVAQFYQSQLPESASIYI